MTLERKHQHPLVLNQMVTIQEKARIRMIVNKMVQEILVVPVLVKEAPIVMTMTMTMMMTKVERKTTPLIL